MLRGRHWTCWSFDKVRWIPAVSWRFLCCTQSGPNLICAKHTSMQALVPTLSTFNHRFLYSALCAYVFVCNSCSVCWSHITAGMCHCWGRRKLTTGQRNYYLPRSSRHLGSRHAAACGEPRQTHAHTETHTSVHECVWQRKREMDRHGYMKQSETESWEKRSELP